jgi:hypothetical protein
MKLMQQSQVLNTPKLTEVFTTTTGTVFQCDCESCWYIDFGGNLARFDYRCLLLLKKAVYNINVEELLLKSAKSADIEIVFICASDHCYVLDTMQIIALKELLEGTFAMLELNHIIYDALYRLAV